MSTTDAAVAGVVTTTAASKLDCTRAVETLGFKAVFVRPNPPRRGVYWYQPRFDPLWEALQDLGVPVGFHEGVACGMLTLWRLDEHWANPGRYENPKLAFRPSEYFRRQCWVSVECEETPAPAAVEQSSAGRTPSCSRRTTRTTTPSTRRPPRTS